MRLGRIIFILSIILLFTARLPIFAASSEEDVTINDPDVLSKLQGQGLPVGAINSINAQVNTASDQQKDKPHGQSSKSSKSNKNNTAQRSFSNAPQPVSKLIKAVPDQLAAKKSKTADSGSGVMRPMGVMQFDQQQDSPRIVATPENIVFIARGTSGNPASQKFKITNGGAGLLSYSITASQNWISIDKSSGSFDTGEDTVEVSVDAAGLSEAQSPYTGELTIANVDNTADKKIVKIRLSIISPESFAKAYSYDQNGNLVRRITPNGDLIDYKYDLLNRLVNIYYPDGNIITYAYDNNGNRVSMSDKTGITQFVYDGSNRLVAVCFPGINPVVYTYDKTGNITKIEYPDLSTVSYTYNSDNKLESVSDKTGLTTYAYYSDTGLLHTKTLPNGVKTTYTYDSAKRIIDVDNRGSGNALISTYHYEYDANGNITSCRETTDSGANTTEYIYDKLNRLKTVTYPDERGTVVYEYDGAGNRTKMTSPQGVTKYKYNSDNQLIRAGKEIFFYDKNGNLIKRVTASKTITYTYDYDNKLTRYQDGVYTVDFEYDGDGRRVSKTVNGAKTYYVNDILRNPFQVIIEANSSWQVIKVYRYGLDRLSQESF
ncbi:MAG: hypothetical protein NTY47_05200 [Candidatus Omnitrophica bacterium]|nr:hypothetical protein [Candidatus Omnitrophota bacterium]